MSKYIKLDDAISIIQKEIDKVEIQSDYDNTFRVGLRLAKNTLESLPTIEVSEDCISRGNLISDLTGIWDTYTPNNMIDFQDMLEDIDYKIRNASPVIPKSKEGEWQITINQDYKCSNCNKITSSYKANYRPNCGAKMKGESH